ALEDGDADVAVRLQLASDPVHLLDERQVEEVDRRVVDGDRGDAAVDVNIEALVARVRHSSLLARGPDRSQGRGHAHGAERKVGLGGRHRNGPLVSSVAVSASLRCNSASQLRPYTRRSPSTRPAGISGRSLPRPPRTTRRPAGARHRAPRRSSSATSPGSSAYHAKGGSAKRRSTAWSRGSTARNGNGCRTRFGGAPSFAALARNTGTACGPGSIASTRRAPRLRASNVKAREPAQQSTTRSPSMRCPSQSNSACLTRSGSGRVSRPRGARR